MKKKKDKVPHSRFLNNSNKLTVIIKSKQKKTTKPVKKWEKKCIKKSAI